MGTSVTNGPPSGRFRTDNGSETLATFGNADLGHAPPDGPYAPALVYIFKITQSSCGFLSMRFISYNRRLHAIYSERSASLDSIPDPAGRPVTFARSAGPCMCTC